MKGIKSHLVRFFLTMGVVLMVSFPVSAAYYTLGKQEVSLDGYLRQEFAYNPNEDSPSSFEGIHTAYSVLLFDASTSFGRNLEVRGIFRLWADMAYAINRGDDHWDKFFRPSQEELMFLDNFEDIVREVYVSYSNSKFQIRFGRQQIGWGESDGLRLMDVINPLDVRRGPFYDTQGYSEVRIPKWLLKTEYYPKRIGPFDDIVLQFIWNPGDIQEQQQLQIPGYVDAHILGMNMWLGDESPYAGQNSVSMPNSGGVWAVQTPGSHTTPFELNFERRTDSIRNSEFGARLSFNIAGTFMTLNFWHGFNHEHLFDFGRLDYHPNGNPMQVGVDPITGDPIMVPMAVYANFYYPRVTYAGLTANREIFWLSRLLNLSTNPVLRFEGLYSFDQELQSTQTPLLFPGGPPSDIFIIYKSDQIRSMIGFDWPLRISFLNPHKNIFFSGQYFHVYTVEMPPGMDSGTLPGTTPSTSMLTLDGSPYKTLTMGRNQSYCTLLMSTSYMQETIVPSVLYVQDLSTGSRWIKSEVLFKIGDHWRPSLRYLYVDGDYQESAFAVYKDRDEIALRIEYQF